MLKKFLGALVVVVVVLGLLTSISIYVSENKPPQLFDVNSPNNRYIISTNGPHYSVSFSGTDTNAGAIVVGSSPVPLEPYLNKEVNITGEFGFGEGKEIICIPGRESECSGDFKAVVFNIETINLVSNGEEILPIETDIDQLPGANINITNEDTNNDPNASSNEEIPLTRATALRITLISPQNGTYISQGEASQKFSWIFDGFLAENQSFEIRFYKNDETIFQAPFGWVKENSQVINLNNLEDGGDYYWTVVIVQGVDGEWEKDVYESERGVIRWEG